MSIFPPKVTQRMAAAGWLTKVDMGCRETRYTLESVLSAIDRMNRGEMPPRLPSEPEPKGTRKVPVRRKFLRTDMA